MSKFFQLFNRMGTLDRYILQQVLEVFVLGVVIFAGIIFASEAFISLIKKISDFGMPFSVAFRMVLLNLPAIIVMVIPMSILFSTIMVLNRLCLASEITVFRACGIGLNRIAAPIFVLATILSLICFIVNETIVPVTSGQSKTLALWALGQKNVPNGKHHFIFKEEGKDGKLKRLIFADRCNNDTLYNVALLDVSSDKDTKISYAKTGKAVDAGWAMQKGLTYNIAKNHKSMTNAWFEEIVIDFGLDLKKEINAKELREYNIIALHKFIEQNKGKKNKSEEERIYDVMFHDKIAFPFTTLALVLLGVPLAITPPRVRYNRGILFSIMILFLLYVIRAFAMSLGESGKIPACLAAWLPNIVLFTLGAWAYWRKVYKIT